MEAVGYVMLFMLHGTLPWADTLGKASATTNQSKEQRVYAIKSTMPVPQICKGAPGLLSSDLLHQQHQHSHTRASNRGVCCVH